MMAVMAKPVKIAAKRLPVISFRIDFSLSPADFWIPSLMTLMP
jgi:hypothetical protein